MLIAADAAVLLISGRLDHIAVTNKLRCFAVDRFRADARKHSEFAGKGADDIGSGASTAILIIWIPFLCMAVPFFRLHILRSRLEDGLVYRRILGFREERR